jgi:hypothetical protein
MQSRFVIPDTGPESVIKPILKQACLPARQIQDDVFRAYPAFISAVTFSD